jgi:Ser-tRNA(Ala) deacylase AlaX
MIENTKNYDAPMHTAEHILNQTMIRMFGINRSFSNHIERKKSKCDYHFDRPLTKAEINEINERVNNIIANQLAIQEVFLSLEEAGSIYNLNKLPEEAGNKIRIINVGDYDSCPCSGEHVENTSEIGVFAISTVDYKNGVLRIRYKLK